MTTKRLPDSLKEASEFILSNITDDTFIPLFTKSGSTEVMKKIKANVLNNGGGGSSTPSAQPDRVIVIDSTLENNIEGKAYKTFAEAKTYMEANSTLYFKVELPAGEFDEQIILNQQWEIHGNNTILTSALDSEIILGEDFSGLFTERKVISDCEIANGFKGIEFIDDIVNAKCYRCNSCYIKRIEPIEEIEYQTIRVSAIFVIDGIINTDDSEDSSSGLYNVMNFASNAFIEKIFINYVYAIYFSCFVSQGAFTNSMLSEYGEVGFINCVIMGMTPTIKGDLEFKRAEFTNCYINADFYIMDDNHLPKPYASMHNSNCCLTIKTAPCTLYCNKSTVSAEVNHSSYSDVTFYLSDSEFHAIDGTIDYVYGDAISSVSVDMSGNIINNHKFNQLMYSSKYDGANMTDDPLGATYVGIIKNPTSMSSPVSYDSPSAYTWVEIAKDY